MTIRKQRLAVIVSHPIQYYCPWFREITKLAKTDLHVFYACRWGVDEYLDLDFGTRIQWDIPLLDGYESSFLPIRREPSKLGFLDVDNPDVGDALSRYQPDVVLVFGYAHRTNWRAAAWGNKNRVPVMLYSDSNGTARRAPWKRAAKAVIVSWIYSHVDGAFASGDNNRIFHQHYGIPDERVFSGTMPIDGKRLVASVGDPSETRREIRKRHGIPEDAFVVVFAGKLSSLKCPLHLLEAVLRCAQRGLKVWGMLVGEGAERPALEEFITEHKMNNIVLAGFVNQSSIGKYYAASDIVTLMSQYEPKGLTIPEAGFFGCPAILSDRIGCIGPNDSARVGENALVYPWSDIDSIANCIARLYNDRPLYRSMSAAALKIAASQDISVAALQLSEAAKLLITMGCRR